MSCTDGLTNNEHIVNTVHVNNSSINTGNTLYLGHLKHLKGIKIFHLNTRSFLPKFDEFCELVTVNSLSVISINETWLSSSISSDEIKIPGYDIFRCDRDGRGGGAALYIEQSLKPSVENCLLTK
jgi:hypothetical protein